MTIITIGFDDLTALGIPSPSKGDVAFQLAAPSPDADSGRITTTTSIPIELDSTGSGQFVTDPTPAGSGVWVFINVPGYPGDPVLVTIPNEDLTFVDLILNHQIDPGTLQPLPSAPTIAEELAATVKTVNGVGPDNNGNVTAGTYDKPDGGIPPSDMTVEAQAGIAAGAGVVALINKPYGIAPLDGDAKLAASAIPDWVTELVPQSQLGVPNGVATLNSAGTLAPAQIPSLAKVAFLGTSANQAAMLAKTGDPGDFTIRTDMPATWVITAGDPTQLSNWTQLVSPPAILGAVQTPDHSTTPLVASATEVPMEPSPPTTILFRPPTSGRVIFTFTAPLGAGASVPTGAQLSVWTTSDSATTPTTKIASLQIVTTVATVGAVHVEWLATLTAGASYKVYLRYLIAGTTLTVYPGVFKVLAA